MSTKDFILFAVYLLVPLAWLEINMLLFLMCAGYYEER